MSDKQLDNVSFEFIRYSNCWEDPEVLLKGLQLDEGSKVMSIASAGDNSFSLLSAGVEMVIAIDISQVQLFLCELKKEAIKQFNRTEFLEFAGFWKSNRRAELYALVREQLSDKCRNYWDVQEDQVINGIIHCGKFEQYFQLFKKDFLHKVHSAEIVSQLFASKSVIEQKEFHDSIWHTEEWKKLYKFFFGEKMMGSQGRDPEFLKHVQGDPHEHILQREVEHFRTPQIQRNHFAYYILFNQFSEGFSNDYLPHYVREGVYEKVQNNIDNLFLFNGLLDDALQQFPDCTHFNLSDIFEYMDETLFKRVSQNILEQSAPKARIAYWNLMVPRYISNEFENVEYQQELSEELKKEDLGYFYRSFIVDQKQ